MMSTDGNSIYHALQTRYEHRLSKGLSFTAAYAWSHNIDDTVGSTNSGGCGCQNPRNRGRAERASSVNDIRHRLVVGYYWELPFAQLPPGATRVFLGGWSLGGIVTLQNGSPIEVSQSGDSQNRDGSPQRPNLVPGQKAAIPSADRNPDRYFNTAAFSRSVLAYGNSPRNPLVGRGLKTFDLSVSKAFRMPFREAHQLLFRAEFFNAFNTPQFGNPGSSLGTASFGRLTSLKSDQRQIQVALKYFF